MSAMYYCGNTQGSKYARTRHKRCPSNVFSPNNHHEKIQCMTCFFFMLGLSERMGLNFWLLNEIFLHSQLHLGSTCKLVSGMEHAQNPTQRKNWSRNAEILCAITATHEIILMVTKFGDHQCKKNKNFKLISSSFGCKHKWTVPCSVTVRENWKCQLSVLLLLVESIFDITNNKCTIISFIELSDNVFSSW